MDLADWVKQVYQLDGSVRSALEMNLQLGAKSISALNCVSPRFDEETLTGAMIGVFVGSYPLCAASYPGTSDDALQWRSYGKSDRGEFGESSAGADFALMLLIPNREPRLAIFQAKSDASTRKKNNRLYVGQIKSSKHYEKDAQGNPTGSATIKYRNQIKALTDAALKIHRLVKPLAALNDLHWVHYLGQFEGGVVAVPLSKIAATVQNSISKVSVESVDMSEGLGVALDGLLRDACSEEPEFWLRVSDAGKNLPAPVDLTHLAGMIPVVVGGGAGAMKANFTIADIEPAPLASVITASSPSPPNATAKKNTLS